jgi:hypothetical protein
MAATAPRPTGFVLDALWAQRGVCLNALPASTGET